jgi:hypothetical protein
MCRLTMNDADPQAWLADVLISVADINPNAATASRRKQVRPPVIRRSLPGDANGNSRQASGQALSRVPDIENLV